MSNEQVIRAFLQHQEARTPKRNITNGIYSYKGRTLRTDGDILINYETIIASWSLTEKNTIELNSKKYSVTTSKIQTKIQQLAENYGIIVVKI